MKVSYYFRNKRVSRRHLVSKFSESFVREITADAEAQFCRLLSVKVGSGYNYLYPTPYGFIRVTVTKG